MEIFQVTYLIISLVLIVDTLAVLLLIVSTFGYFLEEYIVKRWKD